MTDRFEELRTFAAVAEYRSFSKAARALGIALSAVSRRIRELEDRLGAQLLQRTSRQVSLTAIGEALYERAGRVLEDLEEAEAVATTAGGGLTGQIRVAAPFTFGLKLLAPALCDFRHTRPDLLVHLNLDDRIVDVIAGRFDVALRIWRTPELSSLIALRLARVHYVVCGSPAYFEQAGVPRVPEDLVAHRGITYSNITPTEYWKLRDTRTGRLASPRPRTVFECNNDNILQTAAIHGVGVALLPRFVVRDALRDGLLQTVLDDYEREPVHLYVVHPSRRHVPALTKAFVRFVVERFGKELDARPGGPRLAARGPGNHPRTEVA